VTSDPLGSDFCLPAGTPFYVDLSNGTYTVSVLSGDATQKSSMAVRGNGLLELYNMGAPSGLYLEQLFPITITNGRLRLEFFGSICHVNAITITRVPDSQPHKPTIFIASDSTAAAYTQYQYPLTGWGDRIKNYFTDDVVVDDQAKAGRSSKSFIEEGALDTIVNRIRTNDYLFVMMAINDAASDAARKTNPSTTFKAYLRIYVNAARSHGATPVFVTSQTKRTFDIYGRFFNSVGAYPQAMRDLGAELNVPVIDLNAKSINVFDVIGPEATTNAYMFLPPGQYTYWPNGDADYIHLQDRGATLLAKQVVDGIREHKLPIAQYILPVPQLPVTPPARTSYH
jgi:lysophospholipase L1-like esterase